MVKVLITLLFSALTLADYPFFHYNKKKFKLSNESFYRYVRPQLRTIRTEFYYITKKISPEHEHIIPLRKMAFKLKESFDKLKKECAQDIKDLNFCEVNNEILDISYKLDNHILKLKNDMVNSALTTKSIDNYIVFQQYLSEIESNNLKLQSKFELRNIVKKTIYSSYTVSLNDLNNLVTSIFNLSNFAYISFIPDSLKPHFDSLLTHFITPIEKMVISERDKEWFLSNIGKLNLTWNSFHMTLEKGQKGFPLKHIVTVKVMHNRWNSALKIILQPSSL